jgi:hypothetical protein
MALVDKLRAMRELQVEVGGHKFTVRRPSDAERMQWLTGDGMTPVDLIHKCVVAWDLKEVDLVPDGGAVPAVFSSDLFLEYIQNQPDLWGPLSDAIITAIKDRVAQIESAKKN